MSNKKLMTRTQMCEKYKIHLRDLDTLIEAATIKPAHEAPYGRGTMKFFAEAEVGKVIKEHRERAAAAAAAAVKVTTPAPAALPDAAVLAGIQRLLERIDKGQDSLNSAVAEDLESVKEAVKRVTEQNVLMFKKLTEAFNLVRDIPDQLTAPAAKQA